jgi:pimeloyl-ACP methyl ester carboxylesterase
MTGTLKEGGIAFARDGEGPPLLFIHAFPLGLFMWDAQVEGLSPSHEVIRFDTRGFGATAPGEGALTMDRIADDAAAVLDHLGHDRAVLGGCSMGGYACLAFARRHRSRLRGLILIDTRAGADTEEGRKKRQGLAARAIAEGAQPIVDAFLPGLLGSTSHRERPELVARIEAAIRGNPPRGMANALLGMGAREDSFPHLEAIDVPTLVLCGKEDTLTPPAESEALQRGIPRARLELIERAGHLPSLENPYALNDAVSSFLRGI